MITSLNMKITSSSGIAVDKVTVLDEDTGRDITAYDIVYGEQVLTIPALALSTLMFLLEVEFNEAHWSKND